MKSSEMKAKILQAIHERPGSSMAWYAEHFGLSHYRLNRIFRSIQRELECCVIVHDEERGVWIVEIDGSRCLGMNWVGAEAGGFQQCPETILFPDGRCYEHSYYECEEMVALSRRIHFLTGPRGPSVQTLAESATEILHELLQLLEKIRPITKRDCQNKTKFYRLLISAISFRERKQRISASLEGDEIPYELRQRHRNSSGNPYELALRKYFVLLRLPMDAEKQDVLKAWKKLALLYHPDAQGKNGDEEMMKAVNEAKEKIFRFRGWE